MKEFTVCYTLDSDVKWERVIKKPNINTEDVLQEVLKRIKNRKYLIAKTDKGSRIINTASIRYVRIFDKKIV
ncbi:hypothetical protein [Priestia abyssalis]|uniref:hypothetical protein n=1 Tax=Priestia abyssalis TaxID=1221450 RepID=UPI000994C162|nr:hypothetical protein [Priestia abyssalis]